MTNILNFPSFFYSYSSSFTILEHLAQAFGSCSTVVYTIKNFVQQVSLTYSIFEKKKELLEAFQAEKRHAHCTIQTVLENQSQKIFGHFFSLPLCFTEFAFNNYGTYCNYTLFDKLQLQTRNCSPVFTVIYGFCLKPNARMNIFLGSSIPAERQKIKNTITN